MNDLLLRRVSEPRAGADGVDDYDVIGDVSGAHGLVIGRISKAPWHLQQPRGCGGLRTRNERTTALSARVRQR
jgi:hypothetical protein